MNFAAFILIMDYNGNFICHERRKDGKLGLPGGLIELNENPREAARRELEEEYGIDTKNLFIEEVGRVVDDNNRRFFLYRIVLPEGKFNQLVEEVKRNKDNFEVGDIFVKNLNNFLGERDKFHPIALEQLRQAKKTMNFDALI